MQAIVLAGNGIGRKGPSERGTIYYRPDVFPSYGLGAPPTAAARPTTSAATPAPTPAPTPAGSAAPAAAATNGEHSGAWITILVMLLAVTKRRSA